MSNIDNGVNTRSTIANSTITVLSYIIRNFMITQNNTVAYFADNFFKVLMTYVVDICFVQKKFKVNDKLKTIPYSNILARKNYIFNQEIFYKFIIIMIIATIINDNLYKYVNNHLKKNNKLQFTDSKFISLRNITIQILINGFSTLMFVNIMKFKWAYIDYDDMYLTIIILLWFSLSILISVNY
jgi:hypothetical protein